jgi:hypothetical protein
MRRRHLYKEMNLRSWFELKNLVSVVSVLQVEDACGHGRESYSLLCYEGWPTSSNDY